MKISRKAPCDVKSEETPIAELVEGGTFRMPMIVEGNSVAAVGNYITIEPPARLAFSWAGEGPVPF